MYEGVNLQRGGVNTGGLSATQEMRQRRSEVTVELRKVRGRWCKREACLLAVHMSAGDGAFIHVRVERKR